MQYRRLGRSGLKVSALSFGSWVTFAQQISYETARDLMRTAYDHGVNFFDNAEAYAMGRSEETMGAILHELGWPRDTYILSSKVFWGGDRPTQVGLSRKHITDACHAALKRLRTDYLDLYFCHRPDPDTPTDEIVETMTLLIRQGKILYWGTSEWTAAQIAEAAGIARSTHAIAPTMEQPEYNLFRRQRVEIEYAPLYSSIGLGLTTWSPLASGLLTGKHQACRPAEGSRLSMEMYSWLRQKTIDHPSFPQKAQIIQQLQAFAHSLSISLPRLAIAWCLKNPYVSTVILGASRVEQLQENLQALNDTEKLTPEVLNQIEQIVGNKPLPFDNP
ncbi:MAG: aldo/keto reductase [Methylacidiphilales bacterium]|nr:aldo/keto reductase [Candidatus Methylacidiphilales bacterium]MDW8349205.1 aldo/keto reductase [Verrucomicrobiae bacterium]